MQTVNIVGVAVVDALSGPLECYPEPRVRPQVNTQRVMFHPGGGAVNTAATLAHLGVGVAVFTKVGGDPNGRFLRDTLAGYGVDVAGVVLSADNMTPFTFVGVHPGGDRTFIHTPGANLVFCRDDIDETRLFDCRYLLYQDLHVLPRLDGARGAELLAGARGRGIVTLLDECWGLGPDRELFEIMVAQADYVLPSVDELDVMYPREPPGQVAARLRSLGAGVVCVKQGVQGCTVYEDARADRVAAVDTEVVDTTGAGDAFDAGFVAALAAGQQTVEAAQSGARVAAARIGVVGGSSPIAAPA